MMDFSTFKFTIDWTTLFSSLVVALLGSSGISGIIIYIWKSRIEQANKKELEEIKEKNTIELENHRQKLSKELEGYRAGYTQCLNESNIKFSWLHQEQAIAIKETFASLSRLQLSLGEFTSPIQTLSKDPEEQSAFYQNKYDKVVSDYSSAMDSWFPRRLFFIFKEIDMNPEIEKLMTKCKKTLIDYKKAIKTRESEQYDKAEESFQDFKTILEKLQKRFADILN